MIKRLTATALRTGALLLLLFGSSSPLSSQGECSTFFWSNPPTFNGDFSVAMGTINGVGYTYTTTVGAAPTSSVFNHAAFPASFGVPNPNPVIRNTNISSNTLSFDSPLLNPVLVFASIGQPTVPVPIVFSKPIQVLWSTATTLNSPTMITGLEGYAIVRINGTHSNISFDYLADENYVNFLFGAAAQCNIDIVDGCNCSAGLDLDGDSINDLARETIRITAASGQTVTLTVSGGLLQADGITPAAGTATDNGDDTYDFSAYIPADGTSGYSATFTVTGGVDDGAQPSISGGLCTPCELPSGVPAIAQGELILLCVLLLSAGAVMLRTRSVRRAVQGK